MSNVLCEGVEHFLPLSLADTASRRSSKEKMPYRLAITIAGAVSLGSFEAGVLFEVFDALCQHNQTASADQRIYIDVLTGASAGGMTAAIASQTLLYTGAVSDPYNNPFYNAWVAGVDIQGLLPLGPNESSDFSILSSDFVRKIAKQFLLGRYQTAIPTAIKHPALNPAGAISLGLALSNLNGIDYERPLLSGGTFNYTRFQDQILFNLGPKSDTQTSWEPILESAVACGAFPFAFRPCALNRNFGDFSGPFLAPWPKTPRDFAYTDGGVFQNQPLGMAKNLVDLIDHHQQTETRSYLFVSPTPLDPSLSSMTDKEASFKPMLGALIQAIYNQAGFRDWIEAESVNAAVNLLNQRATELLALFSNQTLKASDIRNVTQILLPRLQPSVAELQAARIQLQKQFAAEYASLSARIGSSGADTWIDTVLLLELAADLHEKDEMLIYSITAEKKDLAGAGIFSFLGFLYRNFRDHDYDLGRAKSQAFLTNVKQSSGGKLPQLNYIPKPIHAIQPTPPGGFTASMIPKQNRKDLYNAVAQAADNFLKQEGLSWLVRKGIEAFYVDGKIRKMLDL